MCDKNIKYKVLIIDYIDLIIPPNKTRDEDYIRQKFLELKNIADNYNTNILVNNKKLTLKKKV